MAISLEPVRHAFEHSAAAKHWKNISIGHHHGINVPLFSLHSKDSCGIGEFPDLLPLISWCSAIGMDVIQLLPLNDPGWDSSPYNALSAFALNPLHLGWQQLPNADAHPDLQKGFTELQKLNNLQRVNYKKLVPRKRDLLVQYAAKELPHFSEDPNFLDFQTNNPWLEDYALFLVLKEQNHWLAWWKWPQVYQNPEENTLQELRETYEKEIDTHILLQYLCYQQMKDVKDTATQQGILIKGDIPILISRDSADVWLSRELFKMEYSAGAPPDMYSANGQNWGFPVFNWEEMEGQNYSWWRQRLATASSYYHLYRIDHIVGFFRIWAIPHGKSGKHGHFDPQEEWTWIEHGKKIMLMMLESCPMLPIGEDLGMVPPEVRLCLRELGICGTKVMRWERMWDEDKRFIKMDDYPQESMTTISTHDSETLLQWWKKYRKDAKAYADFKGWRHSPRLTPEQHFELLKDSHHTKSLFHINLLNEYLALLPDMTWPKLDDERINVPGKMSSKNWSYRCRPSVEEITSHQELKKAMKSLLPSN